MHNIYIGICSFIYTYMYFVLDKSNESLISNNSNEGELLSDIEASSNKENEIVPSEQKEGTEDKFAELNEDVLELLGEDDSSKVEEFKFHPELVKRWQRILSEGLKKDAKSQLLDIYPRKGNCPIDTPKLNPEIEAFVNETTKKRDKYLFLDQEVCGASLSAVGEAVTMILESDNEGITKHDLLKLLVDAGKLLCELFNQLTKARKSFIYPGLDKKARTLLTNATTGDFLFGPELTQRIKTATAVTKAGLSLKSQSTVKKTPFRPRTSNWKGPSVRTANQSQTGYRRYEQYRTSYQPRTSKESRRPSTRHASTPSNRPR